MGKWEEKAHIAIEAKNNCKRGRILLEEKIGATRQGEKVYNIVIPRD